MDIDSNEIINSDLFKKEKNFIQHGDVSVYEHSVSVARACLSIATKLRLKMDYDSLVKGALLHDYFLYDWHEHDPSHRLHGFKHPKIAKANAERDFGLNEKEANMILSHMFPLGKTIPKYKESVLLCCVDKYCATKETIMRNKLFRKMKKKKNN